MIYVITVTRRLDYEWELEGYVHANSFPVAVVDKLQKRYGDGYQVYAEEVKELK